MRRASAYLPCASDPLPGGLRGRLSSSQRTPRWREQDSNLRSPVNKDVCKHRDRRRSGAAEPQIGGKLAKTPIWHHCVISVADHRMRQRSRPRHERGGLTGKAYAAMATDTLGRKIRGVAQNSSRQQFWGAGLFLCRLHLQASQNTSTANGGLPESILLPESRFWHDRQ